MLPSLSFFFNYLFLVVLGLHCGVRASHYDGFSYFRAQGLGTWAAVAVAHGLVAPWPVGSSWTKD